MIEGTDLSPIIITGDPTMYDENGSASRMVALVAIIRAARLSQDRELERSAKCELSERFGIKLTFGSDPRILRKGVDRDE